MSNTEKLYQEKEVYGNNGMYRVFHYVEGTDELRMVDTYTAEGQAVERRVFRNEALYSCAIPVPGQNDLLHKTTYREDGSIKFCSEFRSGKVYVTYYDVDENVEATEVRDMFGAYCDV